MKKARNIIIAATLGMLMASCGGNRTPGFAIVIDPQSYEEAKTEVDEYMNTVESRGLYPILVIDRWGMPDSIRTRLIELHSDKTHPIEGCVFIGDIPVVMVRDAQHLTTALKMDQYNPSFDRNEYCIPSDRFYDCFDMDFKLIDQDSVRNEYFFYSLMADCSQVLHPTIYSARIFPRDNEMGGKYEKLRRYLQRVNGADNLNNPLDSVFYFSGEGFISESVDARIDEKIELYDHFPWMKRQHQTIDYIDWKRDTYVKERLLQQMQLEFDFAVLHHHGAPEVEYLSDYASIESIDDAAEVLQRYMREMMREGQRKGMNKAEVMRRVEKFFGCEFPASWFENAFDEDIVAQDNADDELEEQNVNIYFDDFTYYHPQARMVSLDACYNGSFHLDRSIQEGYLFGEGNGTMIVMANSVNVLQDKWVDHFIGLMGLGMRAGHMAQLGAYMEQHIFGDPTFAFTSAADCGFDVNQALLDGNEKFWKKQLDNTYPAVRILAMERLVEMGAQCSDLLADMFKTSESGIVRLAALMELSSFHDDNFVECLALALADGHEMTQRLAANMACKSGDSRLIPGLVAIADRNNTSERIEYDVTNALRTFDSIPVIEEFDRHFATVDCYLHKDSIGELIRRSLLSFTRSTVQEVREKLFDMEASQTVRKSGARALRNNPVHSLVPELLEMLSNPEEDDLILTVLWEAMGWYNISYQAPVIAAKALEISADERFSERVRNEALKTYNRIVR